MAKRGSKRAFWLHKPRGARRELGLLQFFRTDPFCQGLWGADKPPHGSQHPKPPPPAAPRPSTSSQIWFSSLSPPQPHVFSELCLHSLAESLPKICLGCRQGHEMGQKTVLLELSVWIQDGTHVGGCRTGQIGAVTVCPRPAQQGKAPRGRKKRNGDKLGENCTE